MKQNESPIPTLSKISSKAETFLCKPPLRFSIFWLLLLLFLIMPVVLRAQFTFITNNATITITGYTGPGGAVTIPDAINGLPVVRIGTGAFEPCAGLVDITIPKSVTSIGDYVFRGCSTVTNVTIGSGVTNMGSSYLDYTGVYAEWIVFRSCRNLTGITVDSLNSVYSSIDGVLLNKPQTTLIRCPEGKAGSYIVPNTVTKIEEHAFDDCNRLTSITFPDSVANIADGAFQSCTRLTSVTIGNGVATIGNWPFEACNNLTNVVIGKKVNSFGNCPFSTCFNLGAITVDAQNSVYSSVDGVLFNKRQTTLIKCPEGKTGNYKIPNGVTKIADSAFQSCTHLTNITVPKSVTKIGKQGFYLCSAREYYFQGNAPRVGESVIMDEMPPTVTIYHLPGTKGWRGKPWKWLRNCTITNESLYFNGSN